MENPPQEQFYTPLTPLVEPVARRWVPTPNDPPWGAWAAIGTWLGSVLLILFVPVMVLLPYLATQQAPIGDSEQITQFVQNDPTSLFLQILGVIPAHLLTLILAWLVVTKGRKYSFSQTLGWQRGGIYWWHYVLILLAFLVLAGVVTAIYPEQDNDLLRILHSSRSAVYIVAIVATITAPIVEEVIYRGILYSAFQRAFGVGAAFAVATFLFALVHVPQYYPSYSTIFLLALLSVTLTLIRVVSGNLLPCIILHTIFNGLQSVMLILEPYMRSEPESQVSGILHLFR